MAESDGRPLRFFLPDWMEAYVKYRTANGLEIDGDLAAPDSPGLERYRIAKANLAEIELAQKRGELVPLDHFQQITATALGHVSRAAETMCDACRDRYDQAVTAAGDELARVFNDDRSSAEQPD